MQPRQSSTCPWKLTQSQTEESGREQRKRVTFDCSKPTFEGRRSECETGPSELKPKDHNLVTFVKASQMGNDIEENGETDDEDMEDGETGCDDGTQANRLPTPSCTMTHTSTVQIIGASSV